MFIRAFKTYLYYSRIILKFFNEIKQVFQQETLTTHSQQEFNSLFGWKGCENYEKYYL